MKNAVWNEMGIYLGKFKENPEDVFIEIWNVLITNLKLFFVEYLFRLLFSFVFFRFLSFSKEMCDKWLVFDKSTRHLSAEEKWKKEVDVERYHCENMIKKVK